ncbi:MAG: NAD-dependent epimerase/dehydratase family protein [Gammaproteobacteria bacterium]|jgi:nucleoside-diphosphate-sugar epimerase|nr:NAD-dependent epimerase/dehydratase family protein [Gammaproteobacteria bacterium]
MNGFSGKKILVVGGAGFVGSNLVKKLLTHEPQKIIVVDNLLSSEISQVPVDPQIEFIEGSITNDNILFNLPDDLDYVFHLSTYHGNQSSIISPLADHENNTLTTLKLFERLHKMKNLKKVVYASAGCSVAKKTFDKASATVEQEEVSLYLDSPYQMSKIFGEFYGNYYFKLYDFPFVKARFQNVYGPGEILGAGRWRGNENTVWRNVLPTFVFKALHAQTLPLHNNGIATRDFIYVEDTVDGLIACALKGEAGGSYNIASGMETSIFELATMINELTNNHEGVGEIASRNWDRSGKRFGDTTKASTQLGFNAKVNLPEGLSKTIEWTKENINLIKQSMYKHIRYLPEISWYMNK